MRPGAQNLLHSYQSFLAGSERGPNPSSEPFALFEAWLETRAIAVGDHSDTDWIEFLSAAGVTDPEEQFDHMKRLGEWGGIIERARGRRPRG